MAMHQNSYERRREALERDSLGIPTRACECEECPAQRPGDLVQAMDACSPMLEALSGRGSLPYWQGRTCAEERFPMFADQFRLCESPIEVPLLCALYDCAAYDIAAGRLTVEAQASMPGGYRADVLVTDLASGRKLDVECDGADFHDADRDGHRDADLATFGIRVLRFPGRGMAQNRRARATEVFLSVRRSKATAEARR